MGLFNRKKSNPPSPVRGSVPRHEAPDLQHLKAPKGDILFDIQDAGVLLSEYAGGWLVVYDRASGTYCSAAPVFAGSAQIPNEDLMMLALAVSLAASSRLRVCIHLPHKNKTCYLKYSGQPGDSGAPAYLLPAPDMAHPEEACRCLYTSEGGLLSIALAGRYLRPRTSVFLTPEAIDDGGGLIISRGFMSDQAAEYTYYGLYIPSDRSILPLRLENLRVSLEEMAAHLPLQLLPQDANIYLCLISTQPEAACRFLKLGTCAPGPEGDVYTPIPLDSLYDTLISKPLQMESGGYAALCQEVNGRICLRFFPAADLDKYHSILTAQDMAAQIDLPVFARFDPEITDVDAGYFFQYVEDSLAALQASALPDAARYQLQKRIIANLFGMIDKAADARSKFESYTACYAEGWAALKTLLALFEDDIIMQAVTTRYLKLFLMHCKYDRLPDQEEYLNNILLKYGETEFFTIGTLFLRADILEIKEDTLTVEGYLRIPEALADDGLTLTAYVNTKAAGVRPVPRYTDRYIFDRLLSKDMGFILEVPLTDDSVSIRFGIRSHGFVSLCRKIEFTALSAVTNNLKQAYSVQHDYVLQASAHTISCTHVTDPQMLTDYEERFREEIRSSLGDRAEEIISLRQYYMDDQAQPHTKERWLMIDRADRADDNAEVFFRHVLAHESDRVDPVFILAKDALQFEELSGLGRVLDFHSEDHLKAFLTSQYVFSSQMAPSTTNPFNEDFDYFRDIIRQKKFVFLQHGVTHNDNGNAFSRYSRNFYGIVVSANEEYNYMLSPEFSNPKDSIWLAGMPRFDMLRDDNRRMITIMPTWRKNLTTRVFDEEQGTNVWKVSPAFTESEYFNFYNSLINDSRVIAAAKAHNYTLFFMPHVQFLSMAHEFDNTDPETVTICNYDIRYRDVFAMSSLIMTDYSSVVFDFAYLHKPVLYCQFDKEAFFREHTVKSGYYNFEDYGFGEVTYNYEDTVKTLIEYIESDCQMKEKYNARVDRFFRYHDHNCCERICRTVFELESN